MPGPTLVKPPPVNPAKAPIETVLELTNLYQIGPDIYTNTRELWQPSTARGVYGGAVIAQCLSAAQETVPPPSTANDNAVFHPHSMHCYFVLAGDSSIPILYFVERVRDGRSFLTRTVQARQRGKAIFTTTISFVREGSGGIKTIEHGWDMPNGMHNGWGNALVENSEDLESVKDERESGESSSGPFVAKRLGIYNADSPHPQEKKAHAWLRCKGKISGGISAHLSAVAYMSDSWFIGTAGRVQNVQGVSKALPQRNTQFLTRAIEPSTPGAEPSDVGLVSNTKPAPPGATLGMVVSLDHTIYFHRPMETRADEWLCSEMESPWTGNGRGLVMQRIWNRQGRLIASCVQEGLVRLQQDNAAKKDSKL